MNAKPKSNQVTRILKLVAFFATLFLCLRYFLSGSTITAPVLVEDPRIVDAFSNVCEQQEDTMSAQINEEVVAVATHTKKQLTDPEYLKWFCGPYVYTRIFLEHDLLKDASPDGAPADSECADDAIKRGKYCKWYHMCVWPPEDDIFVSKAIVEGYTWEPEVVGAMMPSLTKGKGIFIDAGGNIGQYTLIGAAMNHVVYTFEPIPEHVEMIKKTLSLNGFSSRVHLFRNALSDYRTMTSINYHKNNKGGATIENINKNLNVNDSYRFTGNKVKLATILLDDMLPHIVSHYPKLNISYWKADIEGFEPRMFRGSVKLFSHYDRPQLGFEVLGKSFNLTQCYLEKLMFALHSLGYRLRILKGWPDSELNSAKKIMDFARIVVSEKKYIDMVLTKEDKPESKAA